MRNVRKPHLQDLGHDRSVDRGRRRHGHSLRSALNAAELLTINFNRRQKHAIYPT
jgi:hypothetical protein